MPNELVVEVTPASMLQSAIDKGLDADSIVKLAEVYERMEARHAEQMFTAALLEFRAACPPVYKLEKGVTHNQGRSETYYAELGRTAREIAPTLGQYGFVYTFDTEETAGGKQGKITTVCRLSHRAGHATTTRFTAPIAPAPGMSDMHAAASASTFAERYALMMALGLVPEKADDDGVRAVAIGAEQVEHLQKLASNIKGFDRDKFLAFARATDWDTIAQADYGRVEQALRDRQPKGKP